MKPKIICLTPVRNEAWILDVFLKATSLWADYIIIADQKSDDGSIEIAKKYPKVILIENNSSLLNEPERQKLLINRAREIPGPKLLFALDADEFISGNAFTTIEWQIMLESNKNTAFYFKWPFLKGNLKTYWSENYKPFALMDNDSPHKHEKTIHNHRLPINDETKSYFMTESSVMHFQFIDWNRMLSKHRWYQCIERLNYPQKSIITIFRQYHHFELVSSKDINNVKSEWFEYYLRNGVSFEKIKKYDNYWWDSQVYEIVKKYGSVMFKYIDLPENSNLLLYYLRRSSKYSKLMVIRGIDKFLRIFF